MDITQALMQLVFPCASTHTITRTHMHTQVMQEEDVSDVAVTDKIQALQCLLEAAQQWSTVT